MSEAHNQSTLGGEGAAGHVLIVDDDAEIRNLAAKFLRAHGHRVTAVRDGREMWPTLKTAGVDLIVLDVMLPGTNGLDLCRELRKTSKIPIIMLTAKGEDVDRIVGLEMGADDYLPKPFNPRELVARLRAILRRASPDDNEDLPEKLQVGDLEISSSARSAKLNGYEVILTSVEFDLLLALVREAGKIVKKEDLSESVLERSLSPYDRSLDMHISNLRKKLGLRANGGERIKTVRSVGYIYTVE